MPYNKGYQLNQAPGSCGWRNVLQYPVTGIRCNSRREKIKFDTQKIINLSKSCRRNVHLCPRNG